MASAPDLDIDTATGPPGPVPAGLAAGLVAWLDGIVAGVHVALAAPRQNEHPTGGTLRLVGIGPEPTPRGTDAQATLICEFLLTVSLDDPAAECDAMANWLFAILARPDLAVVAEPRSSLAATAFGLPPLVAAILRARQPGPPAPARIPRRVLHPLVADIHPLRSIAGEVRTPGGVPVAAVSVIAPALNRQTRTDARGRFALPGIGGAGSVHLVARGRGVEASLDTPGPDSAPAGSDTPIVITLPLED